MAYVMGEHMGFYDNNAGASPYDVSRIGLNPDTGLFVSAKGVLADYGTVHAPAAMLARDAIGSLGARVDFCGGAVSARLLSTAMDAGLSGYVLLDECRAARSDILNMDSSLRYSTAPCVSASVDAGSILARSGLSISEDNTGIGFAEAGGRWAMPDPVSGGLASGGAPAPPAFTVAKAFTFNDATSALTVPMPAAGLGLSVSTTLASEAFGNQRDYAVTLPSSTRLAEVTAFGATHTPSRYSTMQIADHSLRVSAMIHDPAAYRVPAGLDIAAGSAIYGGIPESVALGLSGVGISSAQVNVLGMEPWRRDGSAALTDFLSLDRASLRETLVSSWNHRWPFGSGGLPPMSTEFADHLTDRIRTAVHEAIQSHVTIQGDLIVQMVLVFQAQTGAITLIGRASTN